MIIGIDGNEANVKERVGVNQVAYETLSKINEINDKKRDKNTFIIYLSEKPKDFMPEERKNWKYKVLKAKKLWLISKLTPYLLRNPDDIDIYYTPTHYLPICPNISKVCTIHDLGYLEFSGQFKAKDYWQLKVWSAISINISKYIIAVSINTKKDIVRHYPKAARKIQIAHNGVDKEKFKNDISVKIVRRVKKKYKIDSEYILSLGTLKPSKNIERIIEAYSKLSKNKKDCFRLVIAGKKGWLYRTIFKKAKALGVDVIFTGFVEEEDKPALLKGAKVFISPSHWEGFGIHVLEAMSCGTPVVVSRVASLPEVAGKAGTYVDHEDSDSIAKGMNKIIELDDKRYNKLVTETLMQADKFSWTKTAEKVLKVIND